MGLQLKKSTALGGNVIITFIALFALVAQPMYGLVASYVTGAEAIASAASPVVVSSPGSEVSIAKSDILNLQGAWTADSATGYAVQIANTNQTNIIKSDGYISGSNKTISANEAKTLINNDTLWNSLAQPGVYYWRIAPSASYTNNPATLASLAWSGWAKITVTENVPTGLQLKKDGVNLASGSYVKSDFISGSTVLNFNKTDGAWRYITKLEVNGVEKGQFWNSFNNTWLVKDGAISQGKFGEFGDGTYSYSVATRTESGIVSEFSEPVTLTYDSTKPAATLVNPVADGTLNTIAIQVDATDSIGLDRIVANIYRSSDNKLVKSTQVSVDGAKTGSHTATVNLPEGVYYIKYNASDLAGNISMTGTLSNIVVDTTAPVVSWQLQPEAYYSIGKGFSVRPISPEEGLSKSVYIDSVTPENLVWALTSHDKNFDTKNTNNQTLWDSLSDGTHVFVAVFEDAAKNKTVLNSNTFVVDRTAPEVTISSPSKGSFVKGMTTVTGTATDTTSGINQVTVHLRKVKDNGKFDSFLTTTAVPVVDGVWSTEIDTTAFTDGEYGVTVIASDRAGNQASAGAGGVHLKSITIDNTKPTVQVNLSRASYVISGATVGPNQNPEIEARDKNFEVFKIFKDGVAINDGAKYNGYEFRYANINWLGEGTYIIRAYDRAGNVSDDFEITMDRIAPNGTFTYSNNSAPTSGNVIAYLTTTEPVTISPTGSHRWEATDDTNTKFKHKFTNNGSFDAVVVDAAGNSTTLTAIVNWIDRVNPTGEITYSTTALTRGNVTATLNLSEVATISTAGWTATSNPLVFTKVFTPNANTPKNHEETVIFKDAAGNEGTADISINWQDNKQATVAITDVAVDNTTKKLTFNVSATDEGVAALDVVGVNIYDEKNAAQKLAIGRLTEHNGTNSFGPHLVTVDVAELASGTYTIRAAARDAVSSKETTYATYKFTVDNTPPSVTVNAIATSTNTRPIITGAVDEDAVSVKVSLDNGITWHDAQITGTTWSFPVTEALAIGEHKVIAIASDDAGNTSARDTSSEQDYWKSFEITSARKEIDNSSAGRTNTSNPVVTQSTTNTATPLLNNANAATFAPITGAVTTDGTNTTNSDEGDVAAAATQSAETNEDGEVLAAENNKQAWSLVNLLLTIGIVLASLVALSGLGRKENRRATVRILSLVPAAGALVLLFAAENFTAPMGWVNTWSWLMAAIALAQIIILSMTRKSSDVE